MLSPGTRFGSYEIAESIGAGGMGEGVEHPTAREETVRHIVTEAAHELAVTVLGDHVGPFEGVAGNIRCKDAEACELAPFVLQGLGKRRRQESIVGVDSAYPRSEQRGRLPDVGLLGIREQGLDVETVALVYVPGPNTFLYDTIGRRFVAGVRLNF